MTSIEAWWSRVGAKRCPEAREIFITADAGGGNNYRSHVWKHQLQRVADKLDMSIHVSDFGDSTEFIAAKHQRTTCASPAGSPGIRRPDSFAR